MPEHELGERFAEVRGLNYPAYLIMYGPERNTRTRFRGEHHGTFEATMAYSAEEAHSTLMRNVADYPGHPHEMKLTAIHVVDGQLVEVDL